jgi:hypothetical protein
VYSRINYFIETNEMRFFMKKNMNFKIGPIQSLMAMVIITSALPQLSSAAISCNQVHKYAESTVVKAPEGFMSTKKLRGWDKEDAVAALLAKATDPKLDFESKKWAIIEYSFLNSGKKISSFDDFYSLLLRLPLEQRIEIIKTMSDLAAADRIFYWEKRSQPGYSSLPESTAKYRGPEFLENISADYSSLIERGMKDHTETLDQSKSAEIIALLVDADPNLNYLMRAANDQVHLLVEKVIETQILLCYTKF